MRRRKFKVAVGQLNDQLAQLQGILKEMHDKPDDELAVGEGLTIEHMGPMKVIRLTGNKSGQVIRAREQRYGRDASWRYFIPSESPLTRKTPTPSW